MLTKWQIDKKGYLRHKDSRHVFSSTFSDKMSTVQCSLKAKRLATLCQSKQRIHSQHEVPPARVHSSTAQFQVEQSQQQSDFMSQVRKHQ